MQSLVLPPSSFVTPEFGHPRFNPSPDRLPLNLTRSTNARRYTPRDLPPPRSMSSSVPAEDPLETAGNARRPGHPDLPQPVTTGASAIVSGVASTAVSGSILPPGSPDPAAVHESMLQRIATVPGEEVLRQSFAISDHFPPARLPHALPGQVSAQSSVAPFPQSAFGASPPGGTSRTLPQKPTRRTKAHVASACVNCKKKHLGCDPARPCRRCVLSGKESTCVDVTHKKRGRPPLKAEEASLRTYAAQMDNRGTAGDQQGQTRRTHMHRATSSREIRPMTDLQIPMQAGGMGMRASAGHPQRWSTAVYTHAVDPSLSMQRNMGHRRFSSSGSVQSMVAASPPGYVPVPAGYNPALGGGRMPVGVGRPLSSYGNQGLHPAASPPQYPQTYGVPISTYPDTRMMARMQMGETPVQQRDPREGYVESSVRLPPIYPPPMANQQGHRLSDSYTVASWSPRTREEFLPQQPQQQQQQGARQQVQPQGIIEPMSPSSQMRQAASELEYVDTVPRHMGAISPIEGTSHQLPHARIHDEQQGPETEGEDSRPTKRRKMALDDMVND